MDVFTNRGDDTFNSSFVNAHINGLESSTADDNISSILAEGNKTMLNFPPTYLKVLDPINVVCYILICALGLIGNCLVIYVVIRYTKMKTVTNMYILNLALSDVLFLTMIPVTATTVIVKHWIFGQAMCKIYFILSAVNTFGSGFNLCVMSADRYLAVCHPIRSIKYRTPRIAFCMCLSVWILCGLIMLPIIMYTTTREHHTFKGKFTCALDWPKVNGSVHPGKAFVWYSFILGFVVPVTLITIFYILVVARLRRVAAAKKSNVNRRSHGRVTRLIFIVVAVYVGSWLPYWCFQIDGTINVEPHISFSMIIVINFFTILSLTNSMINPLLYAFLGENFRKSFLKAFNCFTSFSKTRSVCNEKSNYPSTSQTYMRTGNSAAVEERVELTILEENSVASPEPAENKMCLQDSQDDSGFLKPPTKF